jgi:hypothetical protein
MLHICVSLSSGHMLLETAVEVGGLVNFTYYKV